MSDIISHPKKKKQFRVEWHEYYHVSLQLPIPYRKEGKKARGVDADALMFVVTESRVTVGLLKLRLDHGCPPTPWHGQSRWKSLSDNRQTLGEAGRKWFRHV
jgi:hypothetical protein